MKKFSSSCSKSNGSAAGRFAEILLIVVALVAAFALFAACNGGSGSAPSTDGGAGSAGQTTVGQIYLESGVSLDRQALLENETQEIAVSAFGEGSTVVSFGIEQGTLSVISLKDGALSSVVVSLPEEVVDILNGELSSVLLKEANLTQNQTVSASEKEQVKQKLFEASQSVQSQIGEVSSLTYGTQNSYITGSVRQNGSGSVSVLGAVRSDGSVLLFDVLSLQPASQSDIDISAVYAPPAVEEKITISEIYDQNFADIDLMTELEQAFQEVYVTCYSYSTGQTKMYGIDKVTNELSLFYELTRISGNYHLSYNELKCIVPSSISKITNNTKESLLSIIGYTAQEEIFESEAQEIINTIQKAINSIRADITTVGNTSLSDISAHTIITQTRDTLPAPSNDFGEALLNDLGEQGDIIATYVGDKGLPIFDQGEIFDAGYISNLNIVVVYENGNCIIIDEFRVTVPVYENERGDSQAIYQHVLQEGERVYSLQNRTTVEKI